MEQLAVEMPAIAYYPPLPLYAGISAILCAGFLFLAFRKLLRDKKRGKGNAEHHVGRGIRRCDSRARRGFVPTICGDEYLELRFSFGSSAQRNCTGEPDRPHSGGILSPRSATSDCRHG